MSKYISVVFIMACMTLVLSQNNPVDKCNRNVYHFGNEASVTVTCNFNGPIRITEDLTYAALHGVQNPAKQKEDALEEERDLSTNQKTTYRLFMEDSGVNEIDDGGFGYEPNLKELGLRKNALDLVGRYFFVGLPNVEKLDMDENVIKTIQPRSFIPLRNLKSLSMDYNQLTSVSYYTFMGLGQVNFISLTNNNISRWTSAAFASLWQLEYLYLSYNRIASLDGAKLAGMNALKYLSLKNNVITKIADGAFNGKPKLETLDLSGNQLSEISSQTFSGLTSLNSLNLRGNVITSIEDRSFAHMPVLRELDLSHNGLATLSRGLFIGLENINSFKAADNWMQQVALSTDPEFAQARAKLIDAIGIICRKPGVYYADLSGNSLKTMLQNVTKEQLGFDFTDPSKHFCVL